MSFLISLFRQFFSSSKKYSGHRNRKTKRKLRVTTKPFEFSWESETLTAPETVSDEIRGQLKSANSVTDQSEPTDDEAEPEE